MLDTSQVDGSLKKATLFEELVNIASNYRSMIGLDKKDLEELIRNVLDRHYFNINDKLMSTTLLHDTVIIRKKQKHIEGYSKLEIRKIVENLFR